MIMRKIIFTAPNGVDVEGVVLYDSPNFRSSKNFVDSCNDEIVYAQNRLIKLRHTFKLDDEDNYQEFDDPEVEILQEYVSIPELDKLMQMM